LRCAARSPDREEREPTMMTKEKLAELQKTGQEHVDAAKAIYTAAAGRDLSPSEQADYDREMATAKDYLGRIRTARDDLAVVSETQRISEAIGGGLNGPPNDGTPAAKAGQRLTFKGMAARLAGQIRPPDHLQKALSPSGAAVVSQEFTADPVALGRAPLGLLDVIPVIPHATPEISYLRQTARTNNAAVVPAGALKPTSVYSVTRIEASLQVIAHLSEGIARHWLLDNTALEQFLANELEFGLQVAVESKVLADINGTSGIQSQAYSTSVLATLRRGITKLETAGYTAGAFVLAPGDWEGVELGLSSVAAIEHLSLPYDPATRRLFGVPVTTSNAQAAGVGHVIASGAVALDTDTRGVDVQWSENATADSFGKNLVFARCESRYNTSVFSPLGVVTLDLTA
jgi:HK97 family phage major capsid protein